VEAATTQSRHHVGCKCGTVRCKTVQTKHLATTGGKTCEAVRAGKNKIKMLQNSNLTIGTAAANLSGAMEADTISKNGRSSKSHTSRRNFLRIALTITAILFVFASFAQQNPDYKGNPKANERVIGTVVGRIPHGGYAENNRPDDLQRAYIFLLDKAQKEYPNKVIDLRNIQTVWERSTGDLSCLAKVVDLGVSPATLLNETLVKVVDKAMSKVRAGSRLAIDQVSVTGSELKRETVNDQLIDVLLDNGYKVVAKEYLERLKEEQEQQMRGHNEKTTAQTENFSGIGYFLNVKVNEKSIRVQVINVSTGEYEGNATVVFEKNTINMTAQVGGKLRYERQEFGIGEGGISIPGIRVNPSSTACYQGYVGEWEIINNKLFLTKINLWGELKYGKWILDKLNNQGKVFADWVSGEVRFSQGKVIKFIHMGCVCEQDMFLFFENGILTNKRIVDNRET
jgi:hypothetical protein